jgi:hypothetical protein
MNTRSRAHVDASFWGASIRSQMTLTADELAAAAGISRERLDEMIELGFVDSERAETGGYTAQTAARLRRMLRLQEQLDMELGDAAIIVELLERLDRLEAELQRIRGS